MGIIQYLNSEPTLFVALLICLTFSLCFHEYAHGVVAFYYGDDTAYKAGRLTLNPIAHLDPIGSMMILFIGIGYAKPVPVNAYKLNNPRSDLIKVAAAGPISNLILTFIGILLMHIIIPSQSDIVYTFLQIFIYINAALAVFNLLPVYPLDGGQIFGNLLSKKYPNFAQNLLVYGPKVLIAVILIGLLSGFSILWIIIGPLIKFIITFFEMIILFIIGLF